MQPIKKFERFLFPWSSLKGVVVQSKACVFWERETLYYFDEDHREIK